MKPRRGSGGIDRRGRSKHGGQFVPIPYTMARSPAWRSLNGSSVKVYIELHSRFHGTNNGGLSLSWAEGAKLLGMSKTSVGRALAELEEKGFVQMTRRGQWYGRLASTYSVTDRPMGKNPPSNAWQKWQPPAEKNRVSVLRRTDKDADGSVSAPKQQPMGPPQNPSRAF